MIKTALAALALTVATSPLAALSMVAAPPSILVATFSNPAPIVIPDSAETTSNITVAGLAGNITGLTLTLTGLTHTFPDDLVFGVVNNATGLGFVFMSGAGGGIDVNGVNLTFSDAAATQLPESFVGGGITSGTYQPSNYLGFEFVSFDNALSFADFNGTTANGVWTLYVDDIAAADIGTVAGGWSLNFTTDAVVGGVPEPMTWSLMIVGFGFAGAAMRRRRSTATVAA